MGDRLGQNVIIENKPGAGGVIGAEIVMNAKPDGYTLFYGSSGPMGILPKLLKNITYDPVKNFVTDRGGRGLTAGAAGSARKALQDVQGVRRLREEAIRTELTFSSVGIGSTQHLGGELLSLSIGTKMIHVPYKGSAPAVLDLLAGRIDVGFDNYTPNKGNIEAGKLIPLGRRGREATDLAAGRSDHRRTRLSGCAHGVVVELRGARRHAATDHRQARRRPRRRDLKDPAISQVLRRRGFDRADGTCSRTRRATSTSAKATSSNC